MSLGKGNDRRPVGIVIGLQQLGWSEKYRDARRGEGRHRHQYLAATQPGQWSLIGGADGSYRRFLAGDWKFLCHVLLPIAHISIMAASPPNRANAPLV